jgi:hypothetical protein
MAFNSYMARKFEDGLRPEFRNVLRPLRLATKAEVLDRALLVEQGISESMKRKANAGRATGGETHKKQNIEITNQGTNQRIQARTLPVCATCGKNHSGVCLFNTNKCFNCGQTGHMQSCPQRGRLIPVNNAARPIMEQKVNTNQRTGSNQGQGKAFALVPGDPQSTESVVAGTSASE